MFPALYWAHLFIFIYTCDYFAREGSSSGRNCNLFVFVALASSTVAWHIIEVNIC